MARGNRQNRYIIFVVIPRSKPAESSGSPDGLEYYYDHIAIFATEDNDEAQAVAELLTKDYEDGPGEDYPEGFIFKSEAEMSLKDRVRAHEQLSNLEDWAIEIQTKTEEYVRKVQSVPKLLDTCRQPIHRKAINQPVKQDQKTLLSERQLEIWRLLEGRSLVAKEIGKELDLSGESIRKHIQEMREKLGKECIKTKRSRGYYRPDAPPLGYVETKT